MKSGESESVKTGSVTLLPTTGSIGCALIDFMRRATPKGAAKPWRTRENIEFVNRVAGAGVSQKELEAYIAGCAELVGAREEAPVYWTVRQLFTSPTMDWWRNKVADRAHRAELKAQWELDKAARAAREDAQREAQRAAQRAAPASLDMRRAAAPLKAAVVNRARFQELAEHTLGRLTGSSSAAAPCPKCAVQVAGGEAKCPSCGAQLIDARGVRRRGYGRGA